MYLRMIDSGDFGNALQTAHSFDLDPDLVYQRRWETSDFGKHAVTDFLSKIKKRSYILQQCFLQIPENLDDCRYLIDFGLQGTDLPTLKELDQKSLEEISFIPDDEDEGQGYFDKSYARIFCYLFFSTLKINP